MARSGSRFFGALVLAFGAVTALTGCDQFLAEPFSHTIVGGTPIVRACVPLTITEVSVRLPSEETTSDTVWSATGEIDVDAGDELEIGAAWDGFEIVTDTGTDWLASVFIVEMDVSSALGGDWSTFAYFEPGRLAEGRWIDSWGEPQATPCTHDECAPMWACHNDWPQPTGDPTRLDPTFSPVPSPASTD